MDILEKFFQVRYSQYLWKHKNYTIVGYIYREAYEYYYALWEAQRNNAGIEVQAYIPAVKEIIIERPQRKIKKRKLFKFLDLED
jgi:hypothetical protein